jgi:hypothetical protein
MPGGLCHRCGRKQERSERFDAALCTWCDAWAEGMDAGFDDICENCRGRPSRPSLAREVVPTERSLRRAARYAPFRRRN